jgi:hypothetical protein
VGYTRIRGGLQHLGHELGRNTIKAILENHGIVRRRLAHGLGPLETCSWIARSPSMASNSTNSCLPSTTWRRLVLPTRFDTWSLTSLQQRLVKTGGRLVKHGSYYWLLLAESHLTRRLFGSMLRRIWALPCRPADGQRLSRCTAGRRRDAGREKCPRNVVGGRAAGRMPARPKVVTTARSQRQRMLTGAQVRWPIMRLCAATMRSAAGESN